MRAQRLLQRRDVVEEPIDMMSHETVCFARIYSRTDMDGRMACLRCLTSCSPASSPCRGATMNGRAHVDGTRVERRALNTCACVIIRWICLFSLFFFSFFFLLILSSLPLPCMLLHFNFSLLSGLCAVFFSVTYRHRHRQRHRHRDAEEGRGRFSILFFWQRAALAGGRGG